eukprot:UN27332
MIEHDIIFDPTDTIEPCRNIDHFVISDKNILKYVDDHQDTIDNRSDFSFMPYLKTVFKVITNRKIIVILKGTNLEGG